MLFLAAAISVATTIAILIALLSEAISFFDEVGFRFFTDGDWNPLFADPQFDLEVSERTFLITDAALLVAVPIGLASAIYLSEYATPRVRKVVKPILEVLVGVPTVVFGYFALTFVTPEILQALGIHADLQRALRRDRDGHHDRPDDRLDLRGLDARGPPGAPRGRLRPRLDQAAGRDLSSSRRRSGIVASIAAWRPRGVGETMIVLLAAGLAPNAGVNPTEGYATITTFMGSAAMGDNPAGSIGYEATSPAASPSSCSPSR